MPVRHHSSCSHLVWSVGLALSSVFLVTEVAKYQITLPKYLIQVKKVKTKNSRRDKICVLVFIKQTTKSEYDVLVEIFRQHQASHPVIKLKHQKLK